MLQNMKQALSEHIREQFSIYILVVFVFTAGVAAGALSIRVLGEGQIRELNDYFYSFVDYLTTQQVLNQRLILQQSLLQNAFFVVVLWLCGALFIGFIPTLGVVFYRGFTIGFTVGFLAEQSAMQGVLFSLSAVLPQNLIYVPVTIVSAVVSVSLSLLLLRRRVKKKDFPFGSYFFQYTLVMLIALLGLAAGSVVEAMVTPVFMRAVASLL